MKSQRFIRLTMFALLLQTVFISCHIHINSSNNRLEAALEFADDNRKELEKVLEHYQNDSLKLEAAEFLIKNMPYYYTYKLNDEQEDLYTVALQVCDSARYDKRFDYLRTFPYSKQPKVYDAHVMKADFLIENIDYSFKVWRERPWGKYLSFDDFCEFILPYRIVDEPLTHWKKNFYQKYTSILDSLYQGTDVAEACFLFRNHLLQPEWNYFYDFELPQLPAEFLEANRIGSCKNIATFLVYIMRSVGIPIAIDNYLYSPIRQKGHFWNALIDTTGVALSFDHTGRGPKRGKQQVDMIKGKVYRYCYALQIERLYSLQKGFCVPASLDNFFLKDVSYDYFPTEDIYIDCDYVTDDSERPLWMATFSPYGWIPIGEGIYKDGKAVFRHIESGLVYATLYDDGTGNLISAGPAFKIDVETGTVLYFRPKEEGWTIKLVRKYPFDKESQYSLKRMIGGKFEASNRHDFKDADVLYQIKEMPLGRYYEVDIHSTRTYRYVRYISDPQHPGDVAELSWYEPREKNALKGDVLSSPPFLDTPEFEAQNALDGDRLTYFSSATCPGWVGLDLGEPKTIGRIKYMPRNDDNFIVIGEKYELFYYAEGGWKSLGQKIADKEELIYDNAPEHALFWLRNLTRGKEEQVFSYYKGKQYFNLGEVDLMP